MSTQRQIRLKDHPLEYSPDGRPLCRQCKDPVPKGRRTFCGDACVFVWKLRTSPGFVRSQVRKRDKGKCSSCGFDCERFRRELNDLVALAGRDPEKCDQVIAYADQRGFKGRVYYKWGRVLRTKRLWDAHHVIPVSQGGGECGLDGYQTLCVPCHKRMHARSA